MRKVKAVANHRFGCQDRRRNRAGQSLVEYAMALLMVTLVAFTSLFQLGRMLHNPDVTFPILTSGGFSSGAPTMDSASNRLGLYDRLTAALARVLSL